MSSPSPRVDLERLAASGRRTLKTERDVTIEVLGQGDDAVVCKTYHNRGHRLLQTAWRASRARREFESLRAVAAAGVRCTEAVAWSERRRFGCVVESALVTRLVPDSRPVKQVLGDLPRATRFGARRRLATAIGALVGALHARGLLWGAAMPRNVLVLGDPERAELCVCDVPSAVDVGRSLHGHHLALIDLFDGAFSPSRRLDWSATERLRWLLAYTAGDRTAARGLWRQLTNRSVLRHEVTCALAMTWHLYIVMPWRRRRAEPGR